MGVLGERGELGEFMFDVNDIGISRSIAAGTIFNLIQVWNDVVNGIGMI